MISPYCRFIFLLQKVKLKNFDLKLSRATWVPALPASQTQRKYTQDVLEHLCSMICANLVRGINLYVFGRKRLLLNSHSHSSCNTIDREKIAMLSNLINKMAAISTPI